MMTVIKAYFFVFLVLQLFFPQFLYNAVQRDACYVREDIMLAADYDSAVQTCEAR